MDELFHTPQPPAYDFARVLTEALFAAKRERIIRGEALTKGDVIRVIREQDALRLDKPLAKVKAPRKVGMVGVVDEAWIAELELNPTYHGLDIKREVGKAQAWASVRGVGVTRRRMVNWLNRALADLPITYNGQGKSSFAKAAPIGIPEPANWREWARANMANPEHADSTWASFDRSAQEYIASQVSK